MPSVPRSEYRWLLPRIDYHHEILECATPRIIAEYGLRDVHPGRIPPTPHPLLLLLVLFVRRLMKHEPDIIRTILECLTPYIRETPIIRPIRLLFFPEYRAIHRLVADLPNDWGTLDIRSKVTLLYERMNLNDAAAIRHGIVFPTPYVVHITRKQFYGDWTQMMDLYCVPCGVFPMKLTVGNVVYDSCQLSLSEQLDYYMLPTSRLRGSIVPYFNNDMAQTAQEAGFTKKVANSVGRLLFGASRMVSVEKYPKSDDAWREVRKEMEIYQRILRTHRRKD